MLFGEKARIIEPLELNDRVVEIARNILKNIQQHEMIPTS
jgi:hypothetical protein